MMKYVTLPDENLRYPLPFYLAMEEHLARTMQDDELWFTWIVDPTVIIGRNQVLEREVNLDYCRTKNIQVYRRKSGGGCVYADHGNIMFSYICRGSNVTTTFNRYTSRVAEMLRSLGLDAEATGRNDVLVNGCKVSGNAFYHLPGRSIVHGTMLYDTDFENMANAIVPSVNKLRVNGVKSVRQRITTLKPLIALSRDEFIAYAKQNMSDGMMMLTEADVAAIRNIMAGYLDPKWLSGRETVAATLHEGQRIDGVGEIEIQADVKNGRISNFSMSGDFFPLADMTVLYRSLDGVEYRRESVAAVLSGVDVSVYVAGLDNEQLLNLIF